MRNKNFNYGKLQAKDEPVTVADFATRAIFGEKFSIAHLTKSSRMVMIDDVDSRTGFGKNFIAIDKGYAIAERLKASYMLFIDDQVIPCRNKYADVPTCIVARTVAAAIDAVERLGVPTKMYLDYNLRREDIIPFIDWFQNHVRDNNITLPRGFSYEVHGCLNAFEEQTVELVMDVFLKNYKPKKQEAA